MNRKPSVVLLITGAFLLFNTVSCSKGGSDETPPPSGGGGSTTCSGTAGPLFTIVKTLVNDKCVSCHNASVANGGMNFATECNIVTNKARIKVRAVDEGTMPQAGALPQADKDKITAWINAGGGYTN